jgi:hypothetical protein
MGSAAVSIDGGQPRTISLHAASPRHRVIVFARQWAGNGEHTLTITNLGTAGHARIEVDAFIRLVKEV